MQMKPICSMLALDFPRFENLESHYRDKNPNEKGNIRDMATIEQLVVLSNMESINAVLIHQGLQQRERLKQLNSIAINQMKSLLNSSAIKKLK